MYIDTEGTFRAENIYRIAERFGLDCDEVLENISIARAHSVDQQNALVLQAAALMLEDTYSLIGTLKYIILVVDSATHHFRTEYVGRGELSVR